MTTTNDLNQELLKLWQYQNYSTIVPMLYPELHKNSFLWVGINPSYSPKYIKPVLRGTDLQHLIETDQVLHDFFTYSPDLAERDVQKHQDIQRLHHQKYPFFRSREKLYDEVKEKLPVDVIDKLPVTEHIDLFHVRVTDSQEFYRDMRNKEHSTFFEGQLILFKKIVEYIDPQIIIIANAALSNYVLGANSPIKMAGQPISFQLEEGQINGIKTGMAKVNGRDIPVCFFKQLTGGGTKTTEREKLIDHLCQTFSKLCV